MYNLISFETYETISTINEDTATPRGLLLPLGHLCSFLLTPAPPPPRETLSCSFA